MSQASLTIAERDPSLLVSSVADNAGWELSSNSQLIGARA
jgi:hypothetical protein